MNQKIYLAGPWFNDSQLVRLESVKCLLDEIGIRYFSPKDANLYVKGMNAQEVVKVNLDEIKSCDLILVITDEKDVGTIFEAGYAYAKGKQILYVWLTHTENAKFNIMLNETGAVSKNLTQLKQALQIFLENGNLYLYKDNTDLELE